MEPQFRINCKLFSFTELFDGTAQISKTNGLRQKS